MNSFTVRQAAKMLGVSRALVYAYCQSGELPHMRFGLPGRRGTIRIRQDDLELFVLKKRVEGGQEPPPNPAPGEMRPKPVELRHLKLNLS
jgi:excisionase family DNA binding protein